MNGRILMLGWSGEIRRDLAELVAEIDHEAQRIWGPTVGATGRLFLAVKASEGATCGSVAVLEDHDEIPAGFEPVQGFSLSGFWPRDRRLAALREAARHLPVLPPTPATPGRWV